MAGWSEGVLLLGGDQHLWSYPGAWARPWLPKAQTRPLRALAAANRVAYALLSDGKVSRFTGGWSPIEGSAAWGATELGVTEDEHLLVIANGKLRAFSHGGLKPLNCDAIDATAVAGTRDEEAFVLDGTGSLFFNGNGVCEKVTAPAPLRRIAATSERLLAVAVDGSVWRRRNAVWVRLPPPFKSRAGQAPVQKQAQDVAVSAYSTWLADTEGAVFLLSDES